MFLSTVIKMMPLHFLRYLARCTAWIMNQKTTTGMHWKTRVNVALAYPNLSESEQISLAKKIVFNQCMAYAESVKSWSMPPSWSIQQIHTVHNLEVLTSALKSPNGALIITPHLGTWEMMNAWVHQYGIPTIMYKPQKNQKLNQFVLQSRQRLNAKLVPTDANGVKLLFKNLKQGGFSVILPDHVPQPSGGIVVPFFAVPTLTSTLASKMAQKTKCKLVGLSCFRREDGQGFDVYCDDLNDPRLYDADLNIATSALNQAIENMINRFPEHYMWGYKRFKFVPNLPDPYNQPLQKTQDWAKNNPC